MYRERKFPYISALCIRVMQSPFNSILPFDAMRLLKLLKNMMTYEKLPISSLDLDLELYSVALSMTKFMYSSNPLEKGL